MFSLKVEYAIRLLLEMGRVAKSDIEGAPIAWLKGLCEDTYGLSVVINLLKKGGWIKYNKSTGLYYINVDLHKISLYDVCSLINESLPPSLRNDNVSMKLIKILGGIKLTELTNDADSLFLGICQQTDTLVPRHHFRYYRGTGFDKKSKQSLQPINGISFADYASACAHLNHGVPESLILEVFDISKPEWDETLDKWNKKLCDLIAFDPCYGELYGKVYFDPKVGRLAHAMRVVRKDTKMQREEEVEIQELKFKS